MFNNIIPTDREKNAWQTFLYALAKEQKVKVYDRSLEEIQADLNIHKIQILLHESDRCIVVRSLDPSNDMLISIVKRHSLEITVTNIDEY